MTRIKRGSTDNPGFRPERRMMDRQERKKLIMETFNTVANGYDRNALRFFPESAKVLAGLLELKGDEKVLDCATGTGVAALEMARRLPRGTVTAIDFSEEMLARARAKAALLGAANIDFIRMDMQNIDLPADFDAAVSSFGIFFVEDMERQLREMAGKVKKGGRVAVTGFHDGSFQPVVDAFLARMKTYGVEAPPFTWRRIGTEEKVSALFKSAGLKDLKVVRRQMGYYLRDADEYWDIIWYAGFRGLVEKLGDRLEEFKAGHLKEVQAMAAKDGIWLDVDVLFSIATK